MKWWFSSSTIGLGDKDKVIGTDPAIDDNSSDRDKNANVVVDFLPSKLIKNYFVQNHSQCSLFRTSVTIIT